MSKSLEYHQQKGRVDFQWFMHIIEAMGCPLKQNQIPSWIWTTFWSNSHCTPGSHLHPCWHGKTLVTYTFSLAKWLATINNTLTTRTNPMICFRTSLLLTWMPALCSGERTWVLCVRMNVLLVLFLPWVSLPSRFNLRRLYRQILLLEKKGEATQGKQIFFF